MKRTVKKVDRQKYIIEEFNSFSELIKVNDSRTANFADEGGARLRRDNRWCGGTYEEAVEMLMYGWQDKEKIEAINKQIGNLQKMQDTQKISFKNDIVGYAPIVPLALKGVPQNMINTTRKPKKMKVISLIIDVGVSAGVEPSQKLAWGAKMTSTIMNLEKQGFRVKIECAKVTSRDNWSQTVHVLKVPVKNENQPFDIRRMMFPIAHPAMQRRIAFDWYERLPEAEHFDGYGTPLIHHSSDHRETVKKNIADTENSYFICCMEDIDKVLKGVA